MSDFVEQGIKDVQVALEVLKVIHGIKKPFVVTVDGRSWSIDLANAKVTPGRVEGKTEFEVELTEENLKGVLAQKIDPVQAVIQGKIKIKGSMAHAMKLQALRPKLEKIRAKY